MHSDSGQNVDELDANHSFLQMPWIMRNGSVAGRRSQRQGGLTRYYSVSQSQQEMVGATPEWFQVRTPRTVAER